MDWSAIAGDVGKAAPLLGEVLGGPAGPAVGALVSLVLGTPAGDPAAVQKAMVSDPQAIVKIKQIEADHQVKLQALQLQATTAQLGADTQDISSINQTMQVEDKTSRAQWRDWVGYILAMSLGAVVILCCYMTITSLVTNRPAIILQIPSVIEAFAMLFAVPMTLLGAHAVVEAHQAGKAAVVLAGQGIASAG